MNTQCSVEDIATLYVVMCRMGTICVSLVNQTAMKRMKKKNSLARGRPPGTSIETDWSGCLAEKSVREFTLLIRPIRFFPYITCITVPFRFCVLPSQANITLCVYDCTNRYAQHGLRAGCAGKYGGHGREASGVTIHGQGLGIVDAFGTACRPRL